MARLEPWRPVRAAAAFMTLAASVAVGGAVAPASAALEISDVGVQVSAPGSAVGAFTAVVKVVNDGTLPRLTDTVKITTSGGTITAASGCTGVPSAAVTCTESGLGAGSSKSIPVTVAPAGLPAVAVTTSATVTPSSLQPDLNAPQPDDDESASATTQLPYDLDVGLSGSPQIIQQGSDTLLHATVHNAGNAQSSTLTVATGGTVDTRLPLRAGCTMDSAQATVTCATGVIAAGGTYAADISVASAPTATSMTSTATVTPQADNPPDGSDETASWTTTVTSTAQAFVPQTGALSFASSDSVVNDTFSVPQGSAPGIFLTLDEATVSAVCGAGTCNPHAAEAVFPATGQYAATDPSHPLVFDITYNVKQVCNGLGTPSGCLPIFWMEPGQTVATQVLQCPTYSQTTRQAPRMNNGNAPCLNFVFKTTGIVTYEVALIKDIVIPFLGSQKSGG